MQPTGLHAKRGKLLACYIVARTASCALNANADSPVFPLASPPRSCLLMRGNKTLLGEGGGEPRLRVGVGRLPRVPRHG